nr:MAG TPA: hypothetical protein [Caudoviricetes sp.]
MNITQQARNVRGISSRRTGPRHLQNEEDSTYHHVR